MSQEKVILTLTTIPERLSYEHPLGLKRVIYSLINLKYDNYEIHFNIPHKNKKSLIVAFTSSKALWLSIPLIFKYDTKDSRL